MYPSQIEFLRHILDECKYLQKEYQLNSFDEFLIWVRFPLRLHFRWIANPPPYRPGLQIPDSKGLSKAVCRSLEIIGEACSKIHPY